MSKDIIVVDGSYYEKVGTDLQQIYVVGFEQKTKSCFSDPEPMVITNTHLEFDEFKQPKETRKERRARERKSKKQNYGK